MVPITQKKLLVAALAALMLAGCGGAEERKAKYLERGKAYIAEENWEKARIEIRNVLQIDPKTAEGYYLLGQVEEKREEWPKAFANYKKAVELDPDLLEARSRLAQFYLLQARAFNARDEREGEANALGQAQHEIDEILRRDPENSAGRALHASILSREGKTAEALELAETVVKQDPRHGQSAALLASLYEQAGRSADAERVLAESAKTADEPIPLKLHLAQLYARGQKNDEAEAVLREVIAARPKELSHRVHLGQFLAQTGQPDKAEAVLAEAIEADPDDQKRYLTLADFLVARKGVPAGIEYLEQVVVKKPGFNDIRLGLAQLYEREKKPEEAKKVYRGMISQFGDEPPGLVARTRLAAHALSAGDKDRADALIKEVLTKNPKDTDALMLRGRMALQSGDYATAVASFRSVLRGQPDSVPVLHLLAEAQLRNGDIELGGDSLRRAVEIAPQNPDARIKYARYLITRKDVVRALEQIDAAIEKDPSNADALAARTEVLAAKGDLDAVKTELVKLKEAAPDNPEASLRLARVHLAEGNTSEALREVDSILDRDAKNVLALILRTDILAAANDLPRLEETLNTLKAAAPENPEGFFRMGRFLRAKGETGQALKEYEQGYGLANESGKSAMLSEIVNTQIGAGQSDQALARVQAVLREDPDHKVAHELLGRVYMARKDYAAAEDAFAKQVQTNPTNPAAYAQLSAAREQRGDASGAAAAYEQGLEALKDNIALLVGLAGLHERTGNLEESITVYERVLSIQPDNAIAVNNLAALLADHRADTQSLSRAKELAAKLEQVDRPAMRDTVGWVYYRTGEYAKSVEVLEGVVNAAPKVPVFQYHLGMAYAKAGQPDKARAALTAALEMGDFAEAEDARKALEAL